MRPVLVTGGAGFIGSALVRHVIRETDRHVVNVDCLTYAGNLDSLEDAARSTRYAFEQVDISDQAEVERVFREHQPGGVLHLAAETHVDRSIDGPQAFVRTNVVGTCMLLQAATRYWRALPARERPAFRFVHVSTDEVFGSLEEDAEERFGPATPYDPSSPYAASKAGADHLVRAWRRTYGLPTIITNCSNNFGPYQFPEKLIPHMILRALEGRSLPVYGDGGNVRDWLHVEDHVAALLAVLDRGYPGSTYLIGGHGERTNLQVVGTVCEVLDRERPRADGRSYRELITFVDDRPGHDRRYAIDPSRLEEELGWQPARSFEEALEATVRWYLEHERWWRRVLQGSYRLERIGAAG